jgi:hypothetical protein
MRNQANETDFYKIFASSHQVDCQEQPTRALQCLNGEIFSLKQRNFQRSEVTIYQGWQGEGGLPVFLIRIRIRIRTFLASRIRIRTH